MQFETIYMYKKLFPYTSPCNQRHSGARGMSGQWCRETICWVTCSLHWRLNRSASATDRVCTSLGLNASNTPEPSNKPTRAQITRYKTCLLDRFSRSGELLFTYFEFSHLRHIQLDYAVHCSVRFLGRPTVSNAFFYFWCCVFDTQTLIYQTALRRPAKSTSQFGPGWTGKNSSDILPIPPINFTGSQKVWNLASISDFSRVLHILVSKQGKRR